MTSLNLNSVAALFGVWITSFSILLISEFIGQSFTYRCKSKLQTEMSVFYGVGVLALLPLSYYYGRTLLVLSISLTLLLNLAKYIYDLRSFEFPRLKATFAFSLVPLLTFAKPWLTIGPSIYSAGNYDPYNYLVGAKQLVNFGFSGPEFYLTAATQDHNLKFQWAATFIIAVLYEFTKLPIYNCFYIVLVVFTTISSLSLYQLIKTISSKLQSKSHTPEKVQVLIVLFSSTTGLYVYTILHGFLGQLTAIGFLIAIINLLFNRESLTERSLQFSISFMMSILLGLYWTYAVYGVVLLIATKVLSAFKRRRSSYTEFVSITIISFIFAPNFASWLIAKNDSLTGMPNWNLKYPTVAQLIGAENIGVNNGGLISSVLGLVLLFITSLLLIILGFKTIQLNIRKEFLTIFLTLNLLYSFFVIQTGPNSYSAWKFATILFFVEISVVMTLVANLIRQKSLSKFLAYFLLALMIYNSDVMFNGWEKSNSKIGASIELINLSNNTKIKQIEGLNIDFNNKEEEFAALAILNNKYLNPVGDAIYYRGESIKTFDTVTDNVTDSESITVDSYWLIVSKTHENI